MTGADLAAAAAENLAAHFTFVQGRLPGMRAAVAGDLTLTSCGMACDTFNAACRARLAPETAERRIREAIAWFAGLPFSWWVGPGDAPADLGRLLEAAGLTAVETEQAMAMSLEGLDERGSDSVRGQAPPLRIVRVGSRGELADYARVEAASWTPPDADVLRFYENAAPVLLAPGSPLRFYVGYSGGEAVAAAELTVAGGVAGLYGIATLEAHRGRGYGSAMTRAPLHDARAEGISIAVLQASVAGAGIYERIGFRRFGDYTEYKP
jgi:ribosomal protein S18 acetylase RimI-like enzyme